MNNSTQTKTVETINPQNKVGTKMEKVNAYEVIVPAFGMFIRRKLQITCGGCRGHFEDKPVPSENMVSKCPFCDAINRLPIQKA